MALAPLSRDLSLGRFNAWDRLRMIFQATRTRLEINRGDEMSNPGLARCSFSRLLEA